jgi:hypothetical protein
VSHWKLCISLYTGGSWLPCLLLTFDKTRNSLSAMFQGTLVELGVMSRTWFDVVGWNELSGMAVRIVDTKLYLFILFQCSALVCRSSCHFNVRGHGVSSGTPEDGWIQPKHFVKWHCKIHNIFFLRVDGTIMSRGSSGSIVSDCGLDDRTIGVRSPAGAKNFSSNLCVQTGSGAHPASCPMGTGGPFPGGKGRPGRDPYHSPPSSAEVDNE